MNGQTPQVAGGHAAGRRRRRLAIGLAAAGVAVAGIAALLRGWNGGAPDAGRADAPALPAGVVEIPAEAQRTGGVTVVTVETRPLPTTLQVTGTVTPVEPRVVHVRPLARGVVERVWVTLGERVRQGDPLVTFDNIELGERVGEYLAEAAALRQAETDLGVRQRVFERARSLIEIEAISQQEVDLSRAEFESAQAALASRRAQLARVEEQLHRFGLSDEDIAALAPTEEHAGHRTASHNVLRAPFAGVVTRYDVAPGAIVDPEEELLTVTDLSEVWVLADVYERDLARVQTGRDVTIATDAYPERIFTGRLTYVSDTIDPATRAAKVRSVVDNRDGALKLDMFVRITIPTDDAREAVVVPADAVQQIDGQPVVFVRRSATRFERRDVEVGAAAGDLREIVAGLRSGETIVAAGSFYLKTALLQERVGEGD